MTSKRSDKPARRKPVRKLTRLRQEKAAWPAVQLPKLPAGYSELLAEIKDHIRTAQVKAVLSVNRELVLLYWQIGREILKRQKKEGWGAKIIERLARDLRQEFPDIKGFSPRNLKYMRAFAEAYPKAKFVQEVLAQITWYHNLTLFEKVKDPTARVWYAQQVIQHSWSRNVLVHQIESNLLFYHLHLRCFVVIDLKVEAFKPEFAGKMNFYLSAVDDHLRQSDDKPSIGLILCKERNRIIVEYALRTSTRPMGVATYKLTRTLPRELKANLPAPEQLEAELQKAGSKKKGQRCKD